FVALVEEKFLGIGARGAIGDILCRILIYGTAILLRTRYHAPQILLPRFQPLPEIVKLLLFHTNDFAAPGRSPNLFDYVWPNENDKRRNSDASTAPVVGRGAVSLLTRLLCGRKVHHYSVVCWSMMPASPSYAPECIGRFELRAK